MRYKLVFAYKGTAFYGYQVQDSHRTVQGDIEKVLRRILQKGIKIYAAGRTDKGVHALNQVAIFDYEKKIDVHKLKFSLNSLLKNDIHINEIELCQDTFHARFSALGKKYVYKMALKENNPLENELIYFVCKKYDLVKLKKAMKLFIGRHDFKNFCVNKEKESYEETIYEFSLKIKDGYLTFTIIGSGFKRYMVRMIIGTCLACGENKISLLEIKDKLIQNERSNVKFKVPPQGLYLAEVYYEKETFKYAKK